MREDLSLSELDINGIPMQNSVIATGQFHIFKSELLSTTPPFTWSEDHHTGKQILSAISPTEMVPTLQSIANGDIIFSLAQENMYLTPSLSPELFSSSSSEQDRMSFEENCLETLDNKHDFADFQLNDQNEQQEMATDIFTTFSMSKTTGILDELKSEVLQYLMNPENEKTVIILHPQVCQKSYGNERRFFCPPPVINFIGKNWNYNDLPFKAYMSLISADKTSGDLIPEVKLPTADEATSSDAGEHNNPSKRLVGKRTKKPKKTKSILNSSNEDELRVKVAVHGNLKNDVVKRVDKISRTSYICDEVDAQKPRKIVTCGMKGLYVSLSDSIEKNFDLLLT
ncbi:hypothetical protein HK096_002881, partial [Nowakowskiella sp. JEL0078]